MTMNRRRQRASILKAATWVVNHPKAWNKKRYFGINTGRVTGTGGEVRGFDIMGATYPNKHAIFSKPTTPAGNEVVAEWVSKNFPDIVIGDIGALNDKSVSAQEAANRVRSYVGKNFPKN